MCHIGTSVPSIICGAALVKQTHKMGSDLRLFLNNDTDRRQLIAFGYNHDFVDRSPFPVKMLRKTKVLHETRAIAPIFDQGEQADWHGGMNTQALT